LILYLGVVLYIFENVYYFRKCQAYNLTFPPTKKKSQHKLSVAIIIFLKKIL